MLKYKTAPSFSIGGRTRYGKKDHVPGPSSYTLPVMFGSKIPIKSSPPSFSMSARCKFGGFNEDLQKVMVIRSLPAMEIILKKTLLFQNFCP